MSEKYRPKKTKYDFSDIDRRRAQGESWKKIAINYGVTRGALQGAYKRNNLKKAKEMKHQELAKIRTNPLEKYENYDNQKHKVIFECDLPEDHPDYYVRVEGPWREKHRRKNHLFFPNRNISTRMKVTPIKQEDGTLLFDAQVEFPGMTYDDICKFFPHSTRAYNRTGLIRAILMEEYFKVGTKREQGNVRTFWYTNLIHTLTEIMKEIPEAAESAIRMAWKEMVEEEGIITYRGMNVKGGKICWGCFSRHSPFSQFLIGVEKESHFKPFSWISELFKINIVAGGGQPGRTESWELVDTMVDDKTNINQPYTILSITDLDPAGAYIENTMSTHLSSALRSWGVEKRSITPERLFLIPDQVTETIFEKYAISCEHNIQKGDKASLKDQQTKYANFLKKWPKAKKLVREVNGKLVGYKVELNAIPESLMTQSLVIKLLASIEDQSLIMIPEIMREVNNQREEHVKPLLEKYTKDFIDPEIKTYLEPLTDMAEEIDSTIKDLMRELREKLIEKDGELDQEYNDNMEVLEDFHKKVEPFLEKQLDDEVPTEDKVPGFKDLKAEREIIDDNIKELKRIIEVIESKISIYEDTQTDIDQDIVDICEEKAPELYETYKGLEEGKTDAENLLDKNWNEDSQILRKKYDAEVKGKEGVYPLRQEENEKKVKKLKEELETEFDPIKTALKEQIKDKISEDNYFILFKDLEEDKDFLQEVKYLLSNPDLVGEELIEKHPSPVFVDYEPLEAATHYILNRLYESDFKPLTNVEQFRTGFTPSLKQVLYSIIEEKIKDVIIDKLEISERKKYDDKLNDLKKDLEKDLAFDMFFLLLKRLFNPGLKRHFLPMVFLPADKD